MEKYRKLKRWYHLQNWDIFFTNHEGKLLNISFEDENIKDIVVNCVFITGSISRRYAYVTVKGASYENPNT